MARIRVKEHPGARTTRLAGRLGDAYKLDVAAPPVAGQANEACIRFFAGLAGVPRAQVRILTGAASRAKLVEIEGVTQEALQHKLP